LDTEASGGQEHIREMLERRDNSLVQPFKTPAKQKGDASVFEPER
jgi:hypothetical protein